MKKYRNYNEENMEIEEEFLRRWKKHKNIIVGKDKDNLEWYDEVIKDLEPYLKEPNIVYVAFDWKKLEFSFKYYLENPVTYRKEYVMGEVCDLVNKYDEVTNNEVEKFFDEYKPLTGLPVMGETECGETEVWFEGSRKVLTFHFKDEIEGLKTWLRAINLTAEKISQMEAQIEVLLKHN